MPIDTNEVKKQKHSRRKLDLQHESFIYLVSSSHLQSPYFSHPHIMSYLTTSSAYRERSQRPVHWISLKLIVWTVPKIFLAKDAAISHGVDLCHWRPCLFWKIAILIESPKFYHWNFENLSKQISCGNLKYKVDDVTKLVLLVRFYEFVKFSKLEECHSGLSFGNFENSNSKF